MIENQVSESVPKKSLRQVVAEWIRHLKEDRSWFQATVKLAAEVVGEASELVELIKRSTRCHIVERMAQEILDAIYHIAEVGKRTQVLILIQM